MAGDIVARQVKNLVGALDALQDGLQRRCDPASRDLASLLYGFAERLAAAFSRWERETDRRHPDATRGTR